MDDIGIVPENTKIICSWFQSCKGFYRGRRIGIALRIGVLRHAPDALYRSILLHIPTHQIHIRAFRRHRNIDHFDTELLGNPEMAVISGYRAEEFDGSLLAPGLAPAINTENPCPHNTVIHQSKA